MPVSDLHLRVGAGALALALVGLGATLRFCGDVSLPALPPRPAAPSGTTGDGLSSTTATVQAYEAYLAKDAARIGIDPPTLAAMASKLPYRIDDTRTTLAPGQPVERAGLRLTLEVADGELGDRIAVLSIENPGAVPVAYQVPTRVSSQQCTGRSILAQDAMVIEPRGRVRRSECKYFDGLNVTLERVEVIELPPLAAYYVSQVPPAYVGIEPRLAAGHKPSGRGHVCSLTASQSLRTQIERGEVSWRDLVDFFARHRCETYQFPKEYRYFKSDGERRLPAMAGGG
ncbi:MAG: hypothetical protein KBG28_16440 [Kofleriaceae bacterium]|jgi:hypothetical protein|nr:hypothetical protein [Kofleriaceae bacterium]MBP6837030.1 hypothetical protein [Kofleriaceae bacterium]MBP9205561.1 hypothetical protein [Kofleriaceae bacterium]